MKNIYKKIELSKMDVVFFIGLLMTIILSIWKIHYGIGGYDESFYITSTYEMNKGQLLFKDIWGVAQTFNFPIWPLSKIYFILGGTSENIMINYRYMYVIVNVIITLVIYIRLKNKIKMLPYICMLYMIVVPCNHSLLSYNCMPFMMAMLGISILVTAKSKVDYIKVGVCFAIACLSQPILAFVFIVIGIGLLVLKIIKKKDYLLKEYWMIFVGCVIAALPVIYYVILKVGISKFIKYLPNQFLDLSTEHNYSIKMYLNTIKEMFPLQIYRIGVIEIRTTYIFVILYCLAVLCLVMGLVAKRRGKKINKIVFGEMIIATIYTIICAMAYQSNCITICLLIWCMVGLLSFDLSDNKVIKKAFILSGCWAIMHCIALLSSNAGFGVFIIAFIPMELISISMGCEVILNKVSDKKIELFVLLIITVMCAGFIRAYGGGMERVSECDYRISSGPMKGIYCTKAEFDRYNNIGKDMNIIKKLKGNKAIVCTRAYVYLFLNDGFCNNSSYCSEVNKQFLEVLRVYFDQAKEPQYVYIDKNDLNQVTLSEVIDALQIVDSDCEKMENGYLLSNISRRR